MDLSVFYVHTISGECTYVRRTSGRSQMEVSGIVIVVHCNEGRPSVQVSGKGILAVCQKQLPVSTVGEFWRILTCFAQCCDQLCKGICLACICIVFIFQSGTQGCVRKLFFPSLNSKLRTVVDGGHAGQCIEQHMNRCKMSLVVQFCVDTLHVVIVYEIV